MPFVPTLAVFFSAAGGVVIRRTFSAGAGRRGLESAAQFSTGCIVIGGTVCRAGSFIQVVILHIIPGSRRWNPPHSLRRAGLLSAAQFRCGVHRRAKKWLLSGAQFPNCRILAAVVIDGTFLKKSTVQRTAGIVIHGTIRFFRGRAVVIRRTIRKNPFFLRRVLPWVVSLRTVCPAGAGVVIDGTIQGFFCTGCYSSHIFPRQDFSIRPVGMLRTFLTFPFFAPGVVILDTF